MSTEDDWFSREQCEPMEALLPSRLRPTTWRAVGRIASGLCLVLLAGCGGAVEYAWANEPDPRVSEYVIGAADELDIRVWRNGELTTNMAVRPDGRITMPLLGDLHVAGLTPTQVEEAIAARLANYVKEEDAVVTVAVTAVHSYNVTVTGNVATPGRFASVSYLTVSDAIALAGGPTRFAEPHMTTVLRRSSGKVRRIPVNYEKIIEGSGEGQNIVLLRDDVVHVP